MEEFKDAIVSSISLTFVLYSSLNEFILLKLDSIEAFKEETLLSKFVVNVFNSVLIEFNSLLNSSTLELYSKVNESNSPFNSLSLEVNSLTFKS